MFPFLPGEKVTLPMISDKPSFSVGFSEKNKMFRDYW
jgi:hypothetical protein